MVNAANTVQKGQTSAPGGGGNGPVGMQISSGPAALAELIIDETMALYSEIISLDSKQKQNMVQAQQGEAKDEASATQSAGWWSGAMMMTQGALGITGAVTSGLMSAGILTTSAEKAEVGSLSESMNSIEKEVTPLQELDKMATTTQALPAGADPANGPVATRVQQLKDGIYEKPMTPEEVANDTPELKLARDNETKAAIAQLKLEPEAYEKFQDNYSSSLNQKTELLNTKVTRYQAIKTNQSSRAQSVGGVFTGLGSAAQGTGSGLQGKYSANATLERTAGQMAADSSGTFGQAMGKAYDSQNGEVQILNAMRQAGNSRA